MRTCRAPRRGAAVLGESLDDGSSQAERVARMKSEFLAAQQRRRERLSKAAPAGDAGTPPQPEPAGDRSTRVAAVRP